MGFRFPFDFLSAVLRKKNIYNYMYMYIYIYEYIYIFISIHIWKTEPMENGNFRLFAANGNRKRKFVFLVRKR
jgi:hypothetical protein